MKITTSKTVEFGKPKKPKAQNSVPPSAINSIKGSKPTQKEFDKMTPAQKAALAKKFPGVYKISADTPTAEDLKKVKPKSKGSMSSGGMKPDYLDLDKDGNKTEPMKSAAKKQAKYGAMTNKMAMTPKAKNGAMKDRRNKK